MITKIQIKSIFGEVLFEYEKENNTIRDTVEQALRAGVNLYGADLYGANLTEANLIEADLTGADLYGADLYGANLYGADLYGANLIGANLTGANLDGANLAGANLDGVNLDGANLYGADLTRVNLTGADLDKVKHLFQIVPEEGAFIAWKKGEDNHLIKLQIPAKAKRHNHIAGRKCRAEFVKVLDIRNSEGHKVEECYNGAHGERILYRVGEIVRPDSYDPDPLVDCSHGIHFFLTKQEAKNWQA